MVNRTVGENVTIFHFDFTKAISHQDNREIFELYRGVITDDGESSLSTPCSTFGGSPSVLSDLELVMITDEDNPKGARALSSFERKLDLALKATKLSFLGPSEMPMNIDVVVEQEVTEDHDSSGESVNLILPAIVCVFI